MYIPIQLTHRLTDGESAFWCSLKCIILILSVFEGDYDSNESASFNKNYEFEGKTDLDDFHVEGAEELVDSDSDVVCEDDDDEDVVKKSGNDGSKAAVKFQKKTTAKEKLPTEGKKRKLPKSGAATTADAPEFSLPSPSKMQSK